MTAKDFVTGLKHAADGESGALLLGARFYCLACLTTSGANKDFM